MDDFKTGWHGYTIPDAIKDNITFRNSQEAFNNAIKCGKLSINAGSSNYAGDYMYMHSTKSDSFDHFKNINTRKYDVKCFVLNAKF